MALPRRAGKRSRAQRLPRQIKELRGGDAGQICDNFTNNALIGFAVMRSQVFGQVMRGVALTRSMADDDDFAAQRCCLGDLLEIGGLFRRPLALFPGLVLVHEVMQEVMRVVGSDDMLRYVIGRDIDLKDLRPMVIHDDQETWRSRAGMSGGLGRDLERQSGLNEEIPDLDHLGTGKILGVGFVHHVTFAGDLEHKLVVGLLLGMANLLDQSDSVAPFEIMRRRVMEYRFERTTVPACYG